jgi:hypothetical protein
MEDVMRAKREKLDEQALLEKNPKAAKILENNKASYKKAKTA